MALTDEIAKAKQAAAIRAWDDGERRLAEQLALDVPKAPLSPDAAARFDVFAKWCAARQVRKLAAKPLSVAAFVVDQAADGVPIQSILAMLAALEIQHDQHSLSNPVRTAPVRAALETIVKVDPPRSWPAEDKARFAMLDPADRYIIAKRENEREVALRRAQNKLAEERRRYEAARTEEPRECLSENVTTQ
jgi:hypothetical protein